MTGAVRVAVLAAAVLLLAPLALLAIAVGIGAEQAAACTAQPAPTAAAGRIPARYLALYEQAGRQYGIPWEILAGIGTVESDNGQSDAPGVHSGQNAYGAAGPMQFGIGGAAGNEWGGAPVHPASERTGGYGVDGDHNGIVDVYDPGDAIPSAAIYLTDHGAPGDMQAALYAYNHSQAYVNLVLAWAARYAAGGATAVAAGTAADCPGPGGPLPPSAAGKILAYALAQIGKPYIWGGTGPDGYDCSGLAMMAYRAAGLYIPRTSQEQWAYGKQIPASRVRPGDLVFYIGEGDGGTEQAPGHVAIIDTWNGTSGTVVVAPETGQLIQIQPALQPGLVGFTDPAAGTTAAAAAG
jgi:peptidoglycan DL-endopeptidase CwlO